MERVRAQRCGLVAAGSNQRYRHSRNVDDQRNLDDSEDVSPRLELVSALGQPHGRFDHDEYATVGQDRGLAERAQILGSPVPVRMIPIGRRTPKRIAKNVTTAATTSPEDPMPADTRPRLPAKIRCRA